MFLFWRIQSRFKLRCVEYSIWFLIIIFLILELLLLLLRLPWCLELSFFVCLIFLEFYLANTISLVAFLLLSNQLFLLTKRNMLFTFLWQYISSNWILWFFVLRLELLLSLLLSMSLSCKLLANILRRSSHFLIYRVC